MIPSAAAASSEVSFASRPGANCAKAGSNAIATPYAAPWKWNENAKAIGRPPQRTTVIRGTSSSASARTAARWKRSPVGVTKPDRSRRPSQRAL